MKIINIVRENIRQPTDLHMGVTARLMDGRV